MDIIKNRVQEYYSEGLKVEQIKVILNISTSTTINMFLDGRKVKYPFVLRDDKGWEYFYQDKRGSYLYLSKDRFRHKELTLNKIKGCFNFRCFLTEGGYIESEMHAHVGEVYNYFIAKIDNYKRKDDIDKTYFESDMLVTNFKVHVNKLF